MDCMLTPLDVRETRESSRKCAALILAAGYEDRARAFLDKIWPADLSNVIVLRYASPPEENEKAFSWMLKKLKTGGRQPKISTIPFNFRKTVELAELLEVTLRKIPDDSGDSLWVDISGLTNYAICVVLYTCRKVFPFKAVKLFYTDADEYFPSESDYRQWSERGKSGNLRDLTPSLTSEMSTNLILDIFSGFTLRKDPTCLILFAGYEKHRSIGVIESVNPSKLVIIHGVPPEAGAGWRPQMSKELHETLVTERVRAEEECSLLDVGENIRLLSEYYEMLYDDHNICIAPICGKMQAVATYLVWERFRDIQLNFPLPVHYLALRSSRGVRGTYHLQLPKPSDRNYSFPQPGRRPPPIPTSNKTLESR